MLINGRVRLTAIIISAFSLVLCIGLLEFSLPELVRFVAGAVMLWFPLTAFSFMLLQHEVRSSSLRLVLSLVTSYALTTLLYFGLTVINLAVVFYALEVVIVAGVLAVLWRRRSVILSAVRAFRPAQQNWILIVLIAGSLFANVHYSRYIFTSEDGTDGQGLITFSVFPDHLYSAALAYELDRHVQPVQATTAGGLPERAYHMFSHLTTVLLARYTGSDDMLRTHLVYHYLMIETLICLLLYCIGKTLTGLRVAGYLSIILMYLFAVASVPLLPNPASHFYFTLFPHWSSGLNPAAYTSPQMYASLVIFYGIFLALIIILQNNLKSADSSASPNNRLLILTAAMIGVMTRFRIHWLIALLPSFLIVMGLLSMRRNRIIYGIAGLVALIITFVLYLEMRSPNYLSASTSIQVGYNRLIEVDPDFGNLLGSWPFSAQLRTHVNNMIANPKLQVMVWQFITVPMFIVLNIIGIPLMMSTAYFYVVRQPNSQFVYLKLHLGVALLICVGTASLLSMNYDPFSVAGQMVFHTRWLFFPFAAFALDAMLRRIQLTVEWSPSRWFIVGVLVLSLFQIALWIRRDRIEAGVVDFNETLTTADYNALLYLRSNTPPDSVVLRRVPVVTTNALQHVVSGIAGRAAYIEASPYHYYVTRFYNQDRFKVVSELWQQSDPDMFCKTLLDTPIDYVVVQEYDLPRLTDTPGCVRVRWRSDGSENMSSEVAVWEVIR